MADSPRTPRPRLPAFTPVPVQRRADGWTPLRQAEFIGVLAETGSVSAAAERVGMARETAYRLRGRPGAEEFARAWDAALAVAGRRVTPAADSGDNRVTPSPAKVTEFEHLKRLLSGRWRPVMRHGKFAGCVREPRNSELLRLVAERRRTFVDRRRTLRAKEFSRPEICNPGGLTHDGPSASPPPVE